MKNVLKDRKKLFFIFGIVLVFVFALTIAYAALNTVLKITGNAEVVASSWDIYLDNAKVTSRSVTTDVVTITDKTTASFQTTLNTPGDFYEFTIDVVNNGSVDAMIDSVEKLPELTEEQLKYINYIIEYQNGDPISTKQLVKANSFVRFKVRVEFRKDISSNDLPVATETLNLSFKVNYVQADESGSIVTDNGVKIVKVVSGNGTTTGDQVCILDECFYVISSTDDTVTMFSKYNLYVGNKYGGSTATPLENTTGIQNELAIGWFSGYSEENPLIATVSFSSTNYWDSTVSSYPTYVYNENSNHYQYVENYKDYLESFGIAINEARLITLEELDNLGCVRTNSNCNDAPTWVYSSSYWSGTSQSSQNVWYVASNGYFNSNIHISDNYGVRPVITIYKALLN